MLVPVIYILYLILTIVVTIWVAHTLHRNGRIFLIDAFHGNEAMADAVNRLLVVGFYLINIGFVALFLKYGEKPVDLIGGFEYIATKVGVVLLVLGIMHFFNMFNFAKMRGKGLRHKYQRQEQVH